MELIRHGPGCNTFSEDFLVNGMRNVTDGRMTEQLESRSCLEESVGRSGDQ